MRDARGLAVSAASAGEVAAVDHFVDQMLSLGPTPDRILEDADGHPRSGLLQAYAAVLRLYGFTEADAAAAREFVERARRAPGLLPREQLWIAVADAWLAGDYEAAMDRCEEITAQWPRDVLAAKVAEFHYYATGQHWQAPRFLAHMERLSEHNQDSTHFLAMHAFALELSGRFDEARDLAERAVAIRRETPWAHHCLAHVFLRRGEIEAGEGLLRNLASSWNDSGLPIRGHNSWHLALFALSRLDYDETLRIHHRAVSGPLPDAIGEQVDAISLLWRLELAGGDAHVEPRAGECFIPFLSAHLLYALGRAGRKDAVGRQLAACRARRNGLAGPRRRVWDDVGIALVDATAALAEGDALRGATLLEPVIDRVGCVGGSDAQDDLFRQAYLVGLIDTGRCASARAYLERLVGARPPTPLEARWAARV